MFKKLKKLKSIFFIVGGIFIMTQIIGCTDSEKERMILGEFNDFLTMFPSEDLTFLFDKEGEVSSVTGEKLESDLEKGDLGTWVVSSYIDVKKENKKEADMVSFGVVLRFNRNTQEAKGELILIDKDDKEYPIYYDKEGIHLVDEDVPSNIKDGLLKFKMMYDFIELDKAYIKSLQNRKFVNNPNAPLNYAYYELSENDKNVAKIKSLYPDLYINEKECELKLESNGRPWYVNGDIRLEIILNKEHSAKFTSSMSFQESEDE